MAKAIREAQEAACSRDQPGDREPCLIMAKPNPRQIAEARKNIRGRQVSELPKIVPWVYAGEVGKELAYANQITVVRTATQRVASACGGGLP
jgi:hypothetical protein